MEVPVSIFIVDDEASIREMLSRWLAEKGYSITTFETADAAFENLGENPPDIIVSDIRMPGMSGIDLLERVKEIEPETQIILMTAFADIETAVSAIKLGAFDYVQKPPDLAKIELLVSRAVERQVLRRENRELRRLVKTSFSETGMVGSSPAMRKIHDLIARVAGGASSVLIEGGSGTGKELVARAIHFSGPKAEAPFCPVNLTAVPEGLIESELFGHVKGAFTGADRDRTGLFAQAGTGTVFLDEIGDISLPFQAKLLRVLQEKEFKPVGSDKTIGFNARIIAATNRDLKEAFAAKEFREDLYFRLNVITIKIPPLRERKEDIPLLVAHFLKKLTKSIGLSKEPVIEKSLLAALKRYPWPGNVRELENTIERMLALYTGESLTIDDLPEEISGKDVAGKALAGGGTLAEIEKRAIIAALEKAGGKRLEAARILGLPKSTFYRKIKEYGLDKP
ncbi:MAG: sigma-54-dependent Fis family transcriptional regulator [Planctomycetota bacterium]|nr:MAG: sigma-54-dependent Fis family transcriptional regulator [Planctomycetota bacterium]